MIFKVKPTLICLIAMFASQPLFAEIVYTCPEISTAKQVADCPADEEMKRMYELTCGLGEDKNPDPSVAGICSSYDAFLQKKQSALWESGDGQYMGYVSCNTPASKIKQGRLLTIGLSQRGVMDKIDCSYEGGVTLSLRTRKQCRIPGAKSNRKVLFLDCSAAGADCKAICE